MTSEQRNQLALQAEVEDELDDMAEIPRLVGPNIRAALATIDAQAEELALLRILAQYHCACPGLGQCTGCRAYREWRAKYGGAR